MEGNPQQERPNDPSKVDYGPAGPAVVRAAGSTPSERYLAKLADRTFLNLWSYPNTFIDKRTGGKGDGKELCDLLVVCGDHILIFSDKTIAWPGGDNIQLAWKRWYKRAVLKSVDQIRGAERWLTQFPNKIFLDRQCTQRLPIKLPPPERRKVHGIVVALGAGDACKSYFGEGIGSLLISSQIKGDAHWNGDNVIPFAVGDVDPNGPFVHVLDDATLDIVLRELDTITDIDEYLTKRENIVRSERLISAAGEEELVAYYMTHMNSRDEHDFTRPDGKDFGKNDHFSLASGFYESLLKTPQYTAKKKADEVSYLWDTLIEAFTNHMLAGTTVVPDGEPFDLSELEQGIRHMAVVPRYKRRLFSESILEALEIGLTTDRFTRAMLPGPDEQDRETGFFFMTLAVPETQLDGGYEQYRSARRKMLEVYAFALLEKHRQLKRIVGIATEPPKGQGASEDMIVAEVDEWSPEFLKDLEDWKKKLNIVQEGNYKKLSRGGNEFPTVKLTPTSDENKSYPNRQQRRAAARKARKQRK